MAFDPQFQRAVDAAADRFRDEMARQTEAIVEELQVSARAERERSVAEARDAALREADARMAGLIAEAEAEARRLGRETGLEEGREAGRAAGIQQGRQEGIEEGKTLGRTGGMKEGFDEGRQQGFIEGRAEGQINGRRDGLSAGIEQGRLEGIEQGRSEGRDQGRAEARREAEKDIEAAVAKAEAAVARAVAIASTDVQSASRASAGRWLEAVRAIGRARSLTGILDALARAAEVETGHAVLFLVQDGGIRTWAGQVEADADVADLINEAARLGTRISRSGRLVVPVVVGAQTVAALCAVDNRQSAVASPQSPVSSPQSPDSSLALELVALFSGRCLEAVTAFQTARVLADATATGSSGNDAATAASAGDQAGEDTAAARRYARLLVSEIKLYHEADVVAGRRDRDLVTRLGGEIARARSLYEQRVARDVHVDHFHEELVRTLANGDETLLEGSGLKA